MRYDSDNNSTSSFDGNGNQTNQVVDARGRLRKDTDALGNSTNFRYDAVMGANVPVFDKRYTYNSFGNVVSQTLPTVKSRYLFFKEETNIQHFP